MVFPMKILVVANSTSSKNIGIKKEALQSVARPDTIVEIQGLRARNPTLPESTEYYNRRMLYVPKIVEAVREAEHEGYDAVLLDCFLNPGLEEAREAVKIPVVGAGQASMLLASTLGHSFAVVSTISNGIVPAKDLAKLYGVYDKVVSWRSAEISVQEMHKISEDEIIEAIFKEAKEAVERDGAEVVVLGCSGIPSIDLQEKLGVPVIDSGIVGFKTAELMADLYLKVGLTHSKKIAYSPPPEISP
jgi:allantoin racemase